MLISCISCAFCLRSVIGSVMLFLWSFLVSEVCQVRCCCSCGHFVKCDKLGAVVLVVIL